MSSPIKKIVVVGGGVIAWWAAIFLKKTVPSINVTILNTEVEDIYAEVPEQEFTYLLKLIGLSDKQIIQYADGNFRGAQSYFNWTSDNENYFHSTEIPDLAHDMIDFNQWLLKLKQAGCLEKVDDYLVRSVAARAGKLTFVSNAKKVDGSLSFDAAIFLNLLKSLEVTQSINVIDQEVQKVILNNRGCIESILTSDNMVWEADFFVDATGVKSSLIGSALGIDYESWADALPCDRKKILISKPRSARLIPFTSIQLSPLGWVKNIPLRSKVISEFIYENSFTEYEMKADASVGLFEDCKERIFNPGMRKKTWEKNCLAVGEAALSADHFSHSSLYLAAVALKRFVDYWPSNSECLAAEFEYNRLMRLEFEMVRDFHCLHYALAQKKHTPFGYLLHSIELPQSLKDRMNLFEVCGRAFVEESTLIHPSQWINLCLGFGFWPQSYDYIAKSNAIDQYKKWSHTIKKNIQENIECLPDCTNYIQTLLTS
jgi:tryptophan halogenase